MRDPYAVLGVRRDAGPEEIRTAWRSLAKTVHPDQNQDDPFATIRFTEAGRAYDLLRDPARRSMYDKAFRETELRREAALRRMEQMRRQQSERKAEPEPQPAGGESAEDMISRIFGTENKGGPEPRATETRASETRAGETPRSGPPARAGDPPRSNDPPRAGDTGRPADAARASEPPASRATATDAAGDDARLAARSALPAPAIFSALVNRIRGLRKRPEKAPDIHREVTVTVEDILAGARVTIEIEDATAAKLHLAPGTTDGHVVRMPEQGLKLPDMKRGDLVVTVRIKAGAYRVDGFDLRTDLPITIQDAVLGSRTTVTGADGREHEVSVPAWSGSDRQLRIEAQGLPDADGKRGDLIAEVRILLHEQPDDKMIDLMRLQREGLYL